MKDKKYAKLADFGRQLLTKTSLVDGLPLISEYAKDVIAAQRCSIFIYDQKAHSLWTTLADGIETITVDSSSGIIGYTLQEREALIVNDPYKHEHFLADVDKDTGYITKNIMQRVVTTRKATLLPYARCVMMKYTGINRSKLQSRTCSFSRQPGPWHF